VDTPETKARTFLRREGVARSRDLERAGVSRAMLAKLVERGAVSRISRGLYSLPDARTSASHQFAAVARHVPRGVICLLSALRFHRLTTQNPYEIWVAVPSKAWRPAGMATGIRFVHVSQRHLDDGVEEHLIDGTKVRMTNPAKTVADCFKFRNSIGTDVAIEALREFLRQSPQKTEALLRHARVDRVERVIRPYLESLA
jgi:predicted transcriptional regulator of viral defense system